RKEGEAQALMKNPYIARILAAAKTEEGAPYLVMEYIEGAQTIDQYCDARSLDVVPRLRLFMLVCEGIQHAHEQGRLHRDLTTRNVLVHDVDGRPVPKVIDFGIAKAIQDDAGDGQGLTAPGVLIGTPEYMSPELFDLTAETSGTRLDVYSLGVMLYRLLT